MLGKIRKMLRNQQGFTLVELMTVLIILGVVLGIGIPKYMQIQNKAEWDADEATIRNFAKAAEAYAASMNSYDEVGITALADANLIDGTMKLNRTVDGEKSVKNTEATNTVKVAGANFAFKFKDETHKPSGNVVNLGAVVKAFIGKPPYGEMPEYSTDVTDDATATPDGGEG
jgi:type IV pilus assembly protein PilA